MNLICCCCTMAPNTRITRKWELFAGRNKFYCDGLLMSAPHTGVFYLTCFLITGTSALFFAFDCPYLATRITPAIPIVGAVLYFFTMSSLLRTTFTDPGVIPRASHDEAAYIEKQIEVPNSLNSPTYRPPPRTKEVLVKGQTVKLKYCFTCKIFRPPRASHCSLCDNCVDRFDHHCPWVGNCVGKRNYRFFYMFLVSLAFLAVFIFSCSVTHLVLLMKIEQEVFEVIKKAPFSVIVTFICFFSIWSVIGLAGFHTYLTTSDQTTNEDLKGSFSSKGGQRAINPYSRGNICLNCVHILCGPMTPSLIDRRGVVTDEYILQMQHNSQNPNNQLIADAGTTPSPLITNQPSFGGIDPSMVAKHRTFDDSNPGIYRHRSYDNLQNGNSNSLARLVDNEMPLSTRDGPAGVVIINSNNNNNINNNSNNNNSLMNNDSINNSQQISPTYTTDDDNIENNILMNRQRCLNNLSGSYNNLFRDNNLDITPTTIKTSQTILIYGNTGSCNDIDQSNNDNIILDNHYHHHDANVGGGGGGGCGVGDDDDVDDDIMIIGGEKNLSSLSVNETSSQSSIILVTTSLPPSATSSPITRGGGGSRIITCGNGGGGGDSKITTTTAAAAALCHQQSINIHEFSFPQLSGNLNVSKNDNSSGGGGGNSSGMMIGCNLLRKSASESENVYSNIPNSNISSSAVSSNGSNKSDPNLHVYSNLIEEQQQQQKTQLLQHQQQYHHQQQQQQQQQQQKHQHQHQHQQQQQKLQQQSQQQNLINLNSKQLSISLNKLHNKCHNDNENLLSSIKKKKITNNSTISPVNSKKQKQQQQQQKQKIQNLNTIPSTLLTDDLDLDDPVSAFVVNNHKKLELSSTNRKTKIRKNSENQQHHHDSSLLELKPDIILPTQPSQSSSSSSSSSVVATTATTTSLGTAATVISSTPLNHSFSTTTTVATATTTAAATTATTTTINLNNSNNSNSNKERERDGNVSFITPSRLRLLQDTTMINTALDLDSLDGSSIGNNSQTCLVKTAIV